MNRLACIRVPGSHEGLTSVLVMNLNALKKKQLGASQVALVVKKAPANAGRNPPWIRKIPWRRA